VDVGGKSASLGVGEETVIETTNKIDEEGFCKTYSEWITVQYCKASIQLEDLEITRTTTGEVSTYHGASGDRIHEEHPGIGASALGIGYVWDKQRVEAHPWRTLYTGNVTYIKAQGNTIGVTAPEMKVGVRLQEKKVVGGLHVWETSDPFLYVLEDKITSYPPPIQEESNILVGVIRSSVDFLSLHSGMEISKLAEVGLTNICRLEQSMRVEAMYSSKESPDELGFRVMGTRGFRAVVAGEALVVSVCTPVPVQLHPQAKCYLDVPVTRNETGNLEFMDPITRALKRLSPEIHCDDDSVPLIKVGAMWVRFGPGLEENSVHESLSVASLYSFRASIPGSGLVYNHDTILAEEQRVPYTTRISEASVKAAGMMDLTLGTNPTRTAFETVVDDTETAIMMYRIGIPLALSMFVVLMLAVGHLYWLHFRMASCDMSNSTQHNSPTASVTINAGKGDISELRSLMGTSHS
jgi:hypothetical protein